MAGTDARSAERWPRLDEHPQAKVEAASLAFALDMTRPWLWDRLDARQQQQVVDYLAPAVGDDTYPQINWVWFRLVVQTFLASVGGPSSESEMRADLATHDSFVKANGWLSDGEERAFDHYGGWALHTFPALWARMEGARDLAAERAGVDVQRLDRYLDDELVLVGADGSPLIQGRSLSYRFAAAAPFWAGILSGVPSHAPGLLRRAATGIVGHFAERDVPGEDGVLPVGWHDAWPPLAQAYTGPGSPYWASKGLMGLMLPADHEAWIAPEQPLPIERADTVRAITAPGWLVSGTVADGIVRVINHGTDHSVEGALVGDSPLYARLGYSTTTFPLLDEESWRSPLDQTVAFVDADGVATHRAGFRSLGVAVERSGPVDVGIAGSVVTAHWLDADARQQHHGSGYTGQATVAGVITVVSIVRGPWEARLVRVDSIADDRIRALRVSGWPISAATHGSTDERDGAVAVQAAGLRSSIACDGAEAGVARVEDASPLGPHSSVPFALLPVGAGEWHLLTVELSSSGSEPAASRAAVNFAKGSGQPGSLVWPDGVVTDTSLSTYLPGLDTRPPGETSAQGRATYPPMEEK